MLSRLTCQVNKAYGDKRGLHETQRQDSSVACYVIVLFKGRNSQLSEQAGRGAAGPVISHSDSLSWQIFLAPEHLHLNHFTHSLLLIHTTDYQKTKLCEQWILEKFIQEKKSLIVKATGVHSSEAAGGCWETAATLIHSDTDILMYIRRILHFECSWNAVQLHCLID